MKDIDALRENPSVLPLSQAVSSAFPTVTLPREEALRARHGVKVLAPPDLDSGTVGVFDEAGDVVSLCEVRAGMLVPQAVFVDA
jgi:hypothetical protein